MSIQREHKDRLFKLLFGSEKYKENTLSLYNAVNGSNYTDVDALELTTIDNAVYMGMHNDLSFLFEAEMNLYEQQSTYNPNEPLRGLFHFSDLYSKYISTHKLNQFGTKRIKLPTPRFVVFYNGTKEADDCTVLRFTDMVNDASRCCIEITAEMLNVNIGRNNELMERCSVLKEYATFIGYIREYKSYNEIETAIDLAVDRCIKEGILKDYLTAHKAEVCKMVLYEYNEAETMEMFKQEGFDEGFDEGLDTGLGLKLIRQICLKIQKNISITQIADELEEELDEIQRIYDVAIKFAPDFDEKKIYQELENKTVSA